MPCHGIDGCWRGYEVNIGYRAYRATTPSAVRVARDPAARAVVELRAGQGVGRQTVINPDHLDEPDDRPAERGADGRDWVWVYARQHGGSGWLPLGDLRRDTETPQPCRGPAGFDFEPGRMPSKHGPHTSCGSVPLMPARWRGRLVLDPDVYVRYSPDGTAFDYLAGGDEVTIRCTGGPRGFVCVSVERSAFVPAGTTGWVEASALGHR
ncbi:MAG TPA: hypothetical protein VMT10_08925 [Solirubrobacteraceae bacterium]|nr:hypothetical protein [Solirubrobacteraceae bacterium]